jgi:hypothetical protein
VVELYIIGVPKKFSITRNVPYLSKELMSYSGKHMQFEIKLVRFYQPYHFSWAVSFLTCFLTCILEMLIPSLLNFSVSDNTAIYKINETYYIINVYCFTTVHSILQLFLKTSVKYILKTDNLAVVLLFSEERAYLDRLLGDPFFT